MAANEDVRKNHEVETELLDLLASAQKIIADVYPHARIHRRIQATLRRLGLRYSGAQSDNLAGHCSRCRSIYVNCYCGPQRHG